MNPKILNFARTMEIELANNDHKGDVFKWRGISDKLIDLEYHKAKLLIAIKANDKVAIQEFLADCANTLLSIGNEYRLYDQLPVDSPTATTIKDDIFHHMPIDEAKKKKSYGIFDTAFMFLDEDLPF